MTIESKIMFKKAKIKLLSKQYAETPSDNPDADLLIGILEVHKAELIALRNLSKNIKAHNLEVKRLNIGKVLAI